MFHLPVRAILYGGNRLPFRAPRAKPAPNATQIAPTTANPMYNGQSEPEKWNQTENEYRVHTNKKATIN